MKFKIEKILSTLSDSSEISWIDDLGEFDVISGKKKIKGRLVIEEDRVSLKVDETNYNIKYLRRKINGAFVAEGVANLNQVTSGMSFNSKDRIRTRRYANQFSTGESVIIQFNTGVHQINNSVITCNAKTIGRDTSATYLGTSNETCQGGGVSKYAFFEII